MGGLCHFVTPVQQKKVDDAAAPKQTKPHSSLGKSFAVDIMLNVSIWASIEVGALDSGAR
jgi:hypothetical protein